MRQLERGESLDFATVSPTHYASIRGSAYALFGRGGCRFETIAPGRVRLWLL